MRESGDDIRTTTCRTSGLAIYTLHGIQIPKVKPDFAAKVFVSRSGEVTVTPYRDAGVSGNWSAEEQAVAVAAITAALTEKDEMQHLLDLLDGM